MCFTYIPCKGFERFKVRRYIFFIPYIFFKPICNFRSHERTSNLRTCAISENTWRTHYATKLGFVQRNTATNCNFCAYDATSRSREGYGTARMVGALNQPEVSIFRAKYLVTITRGHARVISIIRSACEME